MVINRAIGLAMAAQVDRVNEPADVFTQLERARDEIRSLQRLVKELRQRVAAPITGQHGALTTPAVFATAHRVSVSTVNRALNAGEVTGIRQPNDRWLVYQDQVWTPKRKRGIENA